MSLYTPLQDLDHKIDIIDHVNQDHPEELFAIAQHHCQQGEEIYSAKILDIFKEVIFNPAFSFNSSADTIIVAWGVIIIIE